MYAHQCEGIQAQHSGVCQQVRRHNDAIWPQVTIASAAQAELDRVGRFVEHIRSAPELPLELCVQLLVCLSACLIEFVSVSDPQGQTKVNSCLWQKTEAISACRINVWNASFAHLSVRAGKLTHFAKHNLCKNMFAGDTNLVLVLSHQHSICPVLTHMRMPLNGLDVVPCTGHVQKRWR